MEIGFGVQGVASVWRRLAERVGFVPDEQRDRCFNRRQSVEQESEPQGRSRALLRPQCRDRIHVQRAARRDDAGEETDAEHDEQVANQHR